MITEIFLTFLLTFINDVLLIWFMMFINKKRKYMAANVGSLMYLFAALVTVGYVNDKWLIIPAVIGSYLGTISAVTIEEFFSNKKKD